MLGLFRRTSAVREIIADIKAEVEGRTMTAQDLLSLVKQHKPDSTSLKINGEDQIFVRGTEAEFPLEARIPENPGKECVVTLRWKPVWRNEQGSVYFRYVPGTGYMHTYILH